MRIQAQNEQEAIKKAIAASEEKNQQTQVYEDKFRGFSGWNCDEEQGCLGWDGVDRRCECGNRRVAWVAAETNEPGVYIVWGEAY